MSALRLVLCAAALACAAAAASAAPEAPYLSGRVVDDAELLTSAERARMTGMLRAHEERTGNQIAVLTVPTIDGASIEEYALKVFEAWQLGQKSKDNGVLMVVVPHDRKMRIEVGYGLEGTLTDVAASRIIRNTMTPQFKSGAFGRGMEEGIAAIIARLEGKDAVSATGEPAVPVAAPQSVLGGMEEPDLPFAERILFGAFIFGIIGLFTVIGVLTPGMGWFLYVFLIPFWATFPIVVLGVEGTLTLLVVYLIGFPLAKVLIGRMPWYQQAAQDLKTKGRAQVGGITFSSSGSSGSSSWNSGSSSGGFSGGGGRSGGGGSSGSW